MIAPIRDAVTGKFNVRVGFNVSNTENALKSWKFNYSNNLILSINISLNGLNWQIFELW